MVFVFLFRFTPVTVPPVEFTVSDVEDVRNVALFKLIPFPLKEKLVHSNVLELNALT